MDFEKQMQIAFDEIKKDLRDLATLDPFYTEQLLRWLRELSIKNRLIYQSKIQKPDREARQRRRARVYWIDFGVNVGSEFNYPHFGVVLKEFQSHAIVVPISSVKDVAQGWKTKENLYIEIGTIQGLPRPEESYAVVGQIRSISKQRLSDYLDTDTKQHIPLRLTNEQMDLIDEAVRDILTKPQKIHPSSLTTLE